MAYLEHGGDTVTIAQNSLLSLSKTVDEDFLAKAHDLKEPYEIQYAAMRLVRQIEGLQMVIALNGGVQPHTWLPMFYKPSKKEYHPK